MAKDNKGLRTYDGIEGVNLFLGQAGFDLLDSATTVTGDYVAIQVIANGATTDHHVSIAADCKVGDNIGSIAGSTYEIIESGALIYGPFSKIETAAYDDAIVLCYRG